MREIIFRGKRLDNGEWVEGFYNHIPNGRFGTDEHMIQTIKENGKIGMLYDVDPSTVGQNTGLKDKHGKKIFEGDILGSRYDDLCPDDVTIEVVKWFRNGWYVQEKAYSPDLLEEDGVLPVSEIIGNAYDTPELLKEEAQP